MTGNRDSRTAVDKALALLGAFGKEAESGVGVSELARRTDLSKSTAFRVLGMLERNGAVERAGSNYRLGPLLTELTAPVLLPEVEEVRDVLTPFLAHLYERTRQTVHLAMLDGTDVVYLNKLHGLHQVPSPSRIGGRIPAYCTAVGKVLLSHDPELIEQVLGGELPQWTPNTVTDPGQVRSELAHIRRSGIAFDREEIRMGLNCVAAPVLSATGTPVAALSVSGPTQHFDPRSQADALREVCVKASQAYAARHRMLRRSRLPS
ncbi:IclR family transcriptional regulator [Enemella evansiae]|uniref:IclR family transcriptional regulator n=1 Tax=Enemella evansiae TaxID=2016499 RepID=UPI000B965886|nr:IclR family transcriptional regulator [Enemella evansiae]OYO05862.1 IclR family transcriptional regulator [Enemella evansiae]OYO14987.1 IclR family transcriptional regulator [Enemella evansiae]OYO20017.1 IclR family transcriptional regulator [Enemella evansiae]PFG66645.1 IclR family transcriptional regulator [Propionibacteriaceae bacterium ES.041]